MNNSFIVTKLNEALQHELESIHKYFLSHTILEHKGYDKIAPIFKKFSVDEMRHADAIMCRILFIGGLPELNININIKAIDNIETILEMSMKDEELVIQTYNQLIYSFEEEKDYESANLISELLKAEEGHFDWHRKQLDIIRTIGISNYITDIIGTNNE